MPTLSIEQIYNSLAPYFADGDGINDYFTLPIIKHFCPSSATSALEVCCGVGRIAVEIAKNVRTVWGIDLSSEMICYAKQKAETAPNKPVFTQGDVLTFDFGTQTFDFIYGVYFITYFQVDALIQKVIPLLNKGGRFFIVDGTQGPGVPGAQPHGLGDKFRQYTDYSKFMRRYGMSVNCLGWFMHRLKRRALLSSAGWKRVEQWKREQGNNANSQIWTEQLLTILPNVKIEQITSRLACARWDRT
jgi:SAM-dependent methyltransferase